MKLSAKNFLKGHTDKTLNIAFVGMSNIGKSLTARRVAKAYGYKLVEIDKLIWKKLGHDSMDEFADWQGHPYEEGYAEREALSIEMETHATRTAVEKAKGATILDTTGSVIYVDPTVRRQIKENFYVVHIKAETSDLERLKWDYFDNPKPLIWGRQYRPREDLTDRENIFECYPKLLMSRAKEYVAMADVTVTSKFIMDPDLSNEDLLLSFKPPR